MLFFSTLFVFVHGLGQSTWGSESILKCSSYLIKEKQMESMKLVRKLKNEITILFQVFWFLPACPPGLLLPEQDAAGALMSLEVELGTSITGFGVSMQIIRS